MSKNKVILQVSYKLANSDEIKVKTIMKDDSEEFKKELRELEEYLAENRAVDIVYNTITEE